MIKISSRDNEWEKELARFPKEFQAEILAERDPEDIEEIRSYSLKSPKPIKMSVKELLKSNLELLERIPQPILNKINKRYGLNVKTKQVYDRNPARYEQYAKMDPQTAKPSTILNGEIWWGNGRFIAACLRGDVYIWVWELTK